MDDTTTGTTTGTETDQGRGRRRARWRTVAAVVVTLSVASPLSAMATHRFRDVQDASVHAAGIEWLVDAGVTTGCGDGTTFCPSTGSTANKRRTSPRVRRARDRPTRPPLNPPPCAVSPRPQSAAQTGARGPGRTRRADVVCPPLPPALMVTRSGCLPLPPPAYALCETPALTSGVASGHGVPWPDARAPVRRDHLRARGGWRPRARG